MIGTWTPKVGKNNDRKHIEGHDSTYFGGCRFIVNDQTPCYGDFLTATQVPAADPNSLRPVFPDNSRISYKKVNSRNNSNCTYSNNDNYSCFFYLLLLLVTTCS